MMKETLAELLLEAADAIGGDGSDSNLEHRLRLLAKQTAGIIDDQAQQIRVLRVVEYVGPRRWVEETVARSVHGEKRFGPGGVAVIRAATIGTYPEILIDAETGG